MGAAFAAGSCWRLEILLAAAVLNRPANSRGTTSFCEISEYQFAARRKSTARLAILNRAARSHDRPARPRGIKSSCENSWYEFVASRQSTARLAVLNHLAVYAPDCNMWQAACCNMWQHVRHIVAYVAVRRQHLQHIATYSTTVNKL